MKTTKRFMTVLLALCMLFSMVMPTLSVNAKTVASGTCGKNVTWKLDDKGTLTISGSGKIENYDWDKDIDTPWYDMIESIKSIVINKGVTGIGDDAFIYCEKVTGVTIPSSVTFIGEKSFAGCYSLTNITIPNSVTSIGKGAFALCENLTKITIPNGITTINDGTFTGCSRLTGVTIPNSVTNIGVHAFYSCESLKNVTIPNSVKTIGEAAFAYCYSMTDISIPNSVTTIEDNAFAYCCDLTGITIPNSVTKIGNNTFLYCYSMTDVNIPNSVTAIGAYAFSICESLKNVTIPNSVKTIDNYAFADCKSLTDITIPSSVTDIGYGAFSDCSHLQKIRFNGNAPKMYETYYDAANDSYYDGSFVGVTATAYYLDDNTTWTKSVMKNYGGKITWMTFDPADTVPAKPYKITNVVSGVHVYWDDIDGVSKYGLWRSETGKNGTYTWVANPTTYHFTDTKVESGKTYYYKVTAMNTKTNKHSDMSEAIGIAYVSTPDITLRVNRAVGIGLGWDKMDGAKGYAIYRKSYYGNDEWVRVATVSDPNTLSWDDTSVKDNNGEVYKYTIRALAGDDLKTLSGCRSTGRTMVRLTSRTLSGATKESSTSITCTWETTSQATGYEVRFMVDDSVYKTYTIGNYETGTKTFTDLPKDHTYKIQVRTYKNVEGVGSFYSAWSTAKNVTL